MKKQTIYQVIIFPRFPIEVSDVGNRIDIAATDVELLKKVLEEHPDLEGWDIVWTHEHDPQWEAVGIGRFHDDDSITRTFVITDTHLFSDSEEKES